MPKSARERLDPQQAAVLLSAALEEHGCDYALGGALALTYWGRPRGTLDVDLTLYLPADQPSACVRLLQQVGCDVVASRAVSSLTTHGYCQAKFRGCRVDIFLAIGKFHQTARPRRKRVPLGGHQILTFDAESLCVFKFMFFRRQDITDVAQIMRVQGTRLDRSWIARQLEELFGARDPRVREFDALCAEVDSALGGAGV